MAAERQCIEGQYVVEGKRCGKIEVTGGHGLCIRREGQDEILDMSILEYVKGDKLVGVNFKKKFDNIEERIVEIKQYSEQVEKKVVFTKEFLEFVGLWLADGCYNGKLNPGTVYISAMNDAGCRKVVENVAMQWGRELKVAKNGVDGGVGGVEIVRSMRALGLIGHSKTKMIPWWVFDLSEEGIGAVLRGYFSGDGACKMSFDKKLQTWTKSYDHKHVTVSVGSTSRKLVYGVYYLLQMLGINPVLKENDVKKRFGGYNSDTKKFGEIRIYDGYNLKLFFEKVGFVHVGKQERLEQIINTMGEIRGVDIESREDEFYFPIKSVVYNGVVDWKVYDLVVPGIERFNANGIIVKNSGAHSLYNKFTEKQGDRFTDDFSWTNTKEYKDYFESYIKWLNTDGNKDKMDCYINLDVIGSGPKSWENQKTMESCGLRPIPVYHYGDELKYLYKCLDDGYKWIMLGGVAKIGNSDSFYDDVFRKIGRDSNGNPKVKVHGLAATDYNSMTRYPFYSVDSVSWTLYSAYGFALFPQIKKGELVYEQPIVVRCSKVQQKGKTQMFIEDYIRLAGKDLVESYLKELGLMQDEFSIEELVNITDVRCKLNLYYFSKMQDSINAGVCIRKDWAVYKSAGQRKFI